MSEVEWLNQHEQQAWVTFVSGTVLLNRVLDQQLRADAGLSHVQYGILARLSDAPGGSMRMLALAEAMAVSKSGLTYQVVQLEKEGLVSRAACTTDDRGVIAAITPLGMEAMRRAAPGHVNLVRELVIDALTPQQLDLLAECLAQIQRKIVERQM
ncbi:MarR family transcriptional regulator [Antribacter sp. KLBMP9083]|uniref:MarR family transcriptional regulator n=1 Tax=Antribacter soli TaxID=2910976 RepID=A0AA41QA52_9MICO|nr:MarR family transcriptional regulator [Antribacter soli]MCF4119680.1 MarR family transcriptional regulator [Antribacter soli]MCF4123442.1 MarR family transcriptional regulator [Antribacter soli]